MGRKKQTKKCGLTGCAIDCRYCLLNRANAHHRLVGAGELDAQDREAGLVEN